MGHRKKVLIDREILNKAVSVFVFQNFENHHYPVTGPFASFHIYEIATVRWDVPLAIFILL